MYDVLYQLLSDGDADTYAHIPYLLETHSNLMTDCKGAK